MDPDMNKYDVEHVVTAHPKMTEAEWKEAYQTAWGIYYTDEHFETIIRRAYACGINLRSLMPVLFWFSSAVPVEGVHPLQWGIFRIKYRHDRRAGLPLESPIVFYGRYAADIARKLTLVARRWRHLKQIVRKVEADPNAKLYMDEALTAGDRRRRRPYGALHPERGGPHGRRARAPRGRQVREWQWRQGPCARPPFAPMGIRATATTPATLPMTPSITTPTSRTSPFRRWSEFLLDGRDRRLQGLRQGLLSGLGPVTIRNMFGGAGVYADGVMFAILVDDVLYLKADESSQRAFESEGMGPFTYRPAGKGPVAMRYWEVPAASPGGAGGACRMGARSPSHRPRRQGKIAAQAALTDFRTVRTPAA